MKSSQFIKFLNNLHKLTKDQFNTLQTQLKDAFAQPNVIFANLQKELNEHPQCPHCKSDKIIHFGSANNRPRYRCKSCLRTFVCTLGTEFFRLHKPEQWLDYLQSMCQSQTLEACAKKCKINLTTSFNWRHRFLKMASLDQADQLEGIVEADETYFRVSEKGSLKLARAPRKRGTKAKTAGLNSQEWTPVLVAVDRSHHEMDFILNKVSSQEIQNKLQGHLSLDCVLCTDGQNAYNQLCDEQHILHKVLSGHQVIDKTFHINTVNAYHSRLKNWHKRFNGTATKYLANYLGWFRAMETQKHEKANIFKLLALQQHSFHK